MKNVIPKEVLLAIEKGNIYRRIRHKKKADGTNCSVGKDKAMVISKRFDKWIYYCFRCEMYGEVSFDKNTPKITMGLSKRIKHKEYIKEQKEIHLPFDYVPLTHKDGTKAARNWLWGYGIGSGTWQEYKIGWSNAYQRVIVPLFDGKELQGYVARDVTFIPNKEKVLQKVPKYLMKTKDKENRKFFTCFDPAADTVVIVEDILSAIKIKMCSDYSITTLALLNSSLDVDYIYKHFKGMAIKLWLDDY